MATVYLLDLTAYRGEASAPPTTSRGASRDGYAQIYDDNDDKEDTAHTTPPSTGTHSTAPSTTAMNAPADADAPSGVSCAWTAAAELLRWPSWSLTAASWATATRTPANASPLYALVPLPERLAIENKYFRTSLELVVGYPSGLNEETAGRASTRDTATLEVLHKVVQFATCLRAARGELAERLAAENDTHPFGLVLVVHRSQDALTLPWHVFGGSRGAGSLVNAVLVVDDDEAARGHRGGAIRSSVPDDRWHAACVEHGFEYIPHAPLTGSATTPTPVLECIEAGVERSGLLGPSLHGAARLLQLLHSVLWPVTVRTPVTTATATATDAGVDTTAEPSRVNPNSVWLVATADGQAALMAQLNSDREAARESDQDDSVAGRAEGHVALTPPHQPAAALSRYHRRFFTHVVSAGATRRACADWAVLCESSAAATTTSLTTARQLLLVNRYQTALVAIEPLHPAFFHNANSDVLRRLLEQRWRGPSRAVKADRDEDSDESSLAVVVWPPTDRPHENNKDNSGASALAYPSLSTILNALSANGVRHIVVVVVVSLGMPALSDWEAHACAERGVEVVTLSESPTEKACEDEDGPWGVDRLQELLHCTRWPQPVNVRVCGPSTSAKTATPEASSVNRVRVCVCAESEGRDVGSFSDALVEEGWLRTVYKEVMVPLSRHRTAVEEEEEEEAASATAPVALQGRVPLLVDLVPSIALPSAPFHTSNRYFTASLALDVDGGLATALHVPSPVAQQTTTGLPEAVLVVTNARTVLAAAREAGALEKSDDSTARARLVRVLSALQQQLAKEEEAQLVQWTAVDARTEAPADTLALLYITDVAVDAAETVDAVEDALITILRKSEAGAHAGSADLDQTDTYPLFERVWASARAASPPSHSSLPPQKSEDGEEGLARVREALAQHVWPHRTDTAQPAVAAAVADATHKAALSNAMPSVDSADSVRVPATNASDACTGEAAPELVEASMPPPPSVGCALPSDFLIDPVTMRSVRVYALHATWEPVHCAASRVPVPVTHMEEIQQWVDKMRLHGSRLPPVVRKQQAAMLALAMESFL